MKKKIYTKRLYEINEKGRSVYVLIDRLWPRGIKKENAKFDFWMKDIAPSNELRKWFNHEPEKWSGFKEKYINELKEKELLCKEILSYKSEEITLVYTTKEKEHNHAIVLKEYLEENYKIFTEG